MRPALLLLLLASTTFAQSMPPFRRVDSWKSKHNQKRLRLQWEVLPQYKETKLPDGTVEAPRAPWPFVVYAQRNDSKANNKLNEKVFADTRFFLASHAIKPVKIRPSKVIEVPYLASLKGVKDPMLIFVDRDFKVVGVLKKPKDFTDKKVLQLLAKAAKTAYKTKLGAYVGSYFKLLESEEKLWKLEMAMERLREKAAAADKKKAKKYDKEADELEKQLGPAREQWEEDLVKLEDSMRPTEAKKEAIPTTVGSGKNKRKLTPQEIEAIETYREFARDKNPVVRAAAVEDLGGIDSAVIVAVILKAAKDTDFRVVVAAGKALTRMKSQESLEAMHAALQTSHSKGRIAALLGFAGLPRPYPAAVGAIKPFATASDAEVRRAAVKALENMGSDEAADALVKVLSDKEPGLRVMAAKALGNLEAKSAAPALIALIEANDWSLRKAVAEALGQLRTKESIEPLLQAFEKSKGVMDEVYKKALVAITGQDFMYRKPNWRKWWNKFGKSFKVPTDAQVAVAKKKRAEALKGYFNPNKRRYHKIETLSRKLIFVIDISSSMRDKVVIPPYAPDEVKAEFPDRVKLEIAKKELIDLLATLEPYVYFNIITFAGKVKPWRDGLVSASSRTAAIKFVAKLKPMEIPRTSRKKSGSAEHTKTNTYGAIMAAFGLQDAAIPNWKARTKVDTIFFVTDGVPTIGKVTDVPKLIDTVTDFNKTRGVTIHVIVFDVQEAKKLGPLATRNGGQCVVRGFVPKGN